VELFLRTRHTMLKAIDQEFRRAGIEIAFPQQDVHVRSIEQALPIVRQPSKRSALPPRAVSPEDAMAEAAEEELDATGANKENVETR
ncbi:MAG: hypothetical protein C4547_05465, partial [Phycisphaerales bacterium]